MAAPLRKWRAGVAGVRTLLPDVAQRRLLTLPSY